MLHSQWVFLPRFNPSTSLSHFCISKYNVHCISFPQGHRGETGEQPEATWGDGLVFADAQTQHKVFRDSTRRHTQRQEEVGQRTSNVIAHVFNAQFKCVTVNTSLQHVNRVQEVVFTCSRHLNSIYLSWFTCHELVFMLTHLNSIYLSWFTCCELVFMVYTSALECNIVGFP